MEKSLRLCLSVRLTVFPFLPTGLVFGKKGTLFRHATIFWFFHPVMTDPCFPGYSCFQDSQAPPLIASGKISRKPCQDFQQWIPISSNVRGRVQKSVKQILFCLLLKCFYKLLNSVQLSKLPIFILLNLQQCDSSIKFCTCPTIFQYYLTKLFYLMCSIYV